MVMRAAFLKHLDELRASYWFVPSVMALAAIVLSVVTTSIDARLRVDWFESIPLLYSNKPDGARALLVTVAGSMITVAGVIFSLTLLAVSHATSQFGPRLLTNFMRDRGHQLTLGTFIATFLYCLMVLQSIRSAESGDSTELAGAFVPHLSIQIALLLTLCSVGVLIYFIHHVPESMDLSNVVAGVGHALMDMLDDMFPEMIGYEPDDGALSPAATIPDEFDRDAIKVTDERVGFVQAVDDDGILHVATKYDLLIKLHFHPGDFVWRGEQLFSVWPPQKLTNDARDDLRDTVALGSSPTPQQNLLFLVNQLVEVSGRALSPGMNDPFTAMNCVNWLGNMLQILGGRRDPIPYRYDHEGALRIIAPATTFDDVCEAIFSQLRPYVADDRNAALHLMRTIQGVAGTVTSKHRQQVLQTYADDLVKAAEAAGLLDIDLRALKALRG